MRFLKISIKFEGGQFMIAALKKDILLRNRLRKSQKLH
jgi:hypothetical protein